MKPEKPDFMFFEISFKCVKVIFMTNRIILNQTAYSGRGAISQIIGEAKAHGYKKALLVTGKALTRVKIATRIAVLLEGAAVFFIQSP